MKNLIIILLIVLSSCYTRKEAAVQTSECGQWQLILVYGNGYYNTYVVCDSFDMISLTEVVMYNKGNDTKIIAQEIRPIFLPTKCKE